MQYPWLFIPLRPEYKYLEEQTVDEIFRLIKCPTYEILKSDPHWSIHQQWFPRGFKEVIRYNSEYFNKVGSIVLKPGFGHITATFSPLPKTSPLGGTEGGRRVLSPSTGSSASSSPLGGIRGGLFPSFLLSRFAFFLVKHCSKVKPSESLSLRFF